MHTELSIVGRECGITPVLHHVADYLVHDANNRQDSIQYLACVRVQLDASAYEANKPRIRVIKSMDKIIEYKFNHDPFSFPDYIYYTVSYIAQKAPYEEIIESVDTWVKIKGILTQEQKEHLAEARQLFIEEQRDDDTSSDTSEM